MRIWESEMFWNVLSKRSSKIDLVLFVRFVKVENNNQDNVLKNTNVAGDVFAECFD